MFQKLVALQKFCSHTNHGKKNETNYLHDLDVFYIIQPYIAQWCNRSQGFN